MVSEVKKRQWKSLSRGIVVMACAGTKRSEGKNRVLGFRVHCELSERRHPVFEPAVGHLSSMLDVRWLVAPIGLHDVNATFFVFSATRSTATVTSSWR
jgi:hypothetical protein